MPDVFDIAIVGAGCAGLQLLFQLSLQPGWSSKTVLLIDDGETKHQSWCFWSKCNHPLQHLVSKTWNKLDFKSTLFKLQEEIAPFAYHYIAGRDFFDYFKNDFIPAHPNIVLVKGKISVITKKSDLFLLQAEGEVWQAKHCFSSINSVSLSRKPLLWQHFKGWFIEAKENAFDDSAATLMDYSLSIAGKLNFIYVLPFSKSSALIEATYFHQKCCLTRHTINLLFNSLLTAI